LSALVDAAAIRDPTGEAGQLRAPKKKGGPALVESRPRAYASGTEKHEPAPNARSLSRQE